MQEHTNATAFTPATWDQFCGEYQLSIDQRGQFERYAHYLQIWNNQMNLTRIVDTEEIYHYHFLDSLKISEVIDFSSLATIADVGTGAGFPGIPIKILYPHLRVLLIEVHQKKISFLNHVIQELGLENIEVCSLDWRTFLRTTREPIDLFLARASLRPEELVRMFKPGCAYQKAACVYFASKDYVLDKRFEHLLKAEAEYMVGQKARQFLWFANH